MARAKTTKKQTSTPIVGQTDPRAPLDGLAFLKAAQPILKALGEDLLQRAKASPAVQEALVARHSAERSARRTAEDFPGWQRQFVEQVAAAWLLSIVFVRTLEDRGLLDQARIAGPGALDGQRLFLEMAPNLTEREYLLTVFRELSRLPAGRDLFDARHNPVWMLGPSAEGAKALLQLFRQPLADAPVYRFGQADTRFLGDLYQDLNEDVQKRFALLQTPRFVESFILDRTLTRALETVGIGETTLMDPTCGSGHFLLGAFERLFDARLLKEPGLGERQAAKKALEAIAGADINPYAVAIAKFRLTLAFLEKAGFKKLASAPELPLNVVVADSLLYMAGPQRNLYEQQGQSAKVWQGDEYALEDEDAAKAVLGRRYAVVVGNPPYIVPKDEVLRGRYRELYVSASMQYSLGAPFTERFFQLAKDRGHVGMITANSFMKREFGKKLIQEFLPKVNLDLIVNTAGAYIPGHGTPTVLLFGTNEGPLGTDVLTVLANRGEPSTPEKPEEGLVWSSIEANWEKVGFGNEYISVTRIDRKSLAKHPWSLGGGGATELKELIEANAKQKLSDVVEAIGRTTVAGEDDIWISTRGTWARAGLGDAVVTLVIGEAVRDWAIASDYEILYPYIPLGGSPVGKDHLIVTALWPWRVPLENRTVFGKKMREHGRCWWEHLEHYAERLRTPMGLGFPFVATHNHFALERGGRVFNRTAPIIKLPATATEDDHLALLAYLNSSVACFWMKQVFFPKTSGTNVGESRGKPERIAYEFNGTGLQNLPLPALDHKLREIAKLLQRYAEQRQSNEPTAVIARCVGVPPAQWQDRLNAAKEIHAVCLRHMVVLQEEIDWHTYALLGLASKELLAEGRGISIEMMEANVGDRPYLHPAEPSFSNDMPGPLKKLWLARWQAIKASPDLAMIEAPLFKRPWLGVQGVFHRDEWTFEELTTVALRAQLFDSIERVAERDANPQSISAIEQQLRKDEFFDACAAMYKSSEGSVKELCANVLKTESVPFLAAHRYTDTGLEKREAWERTWDLQRQEDAGQKVGEIPVPPKYDSSDYRDPIYWRHRGKLDVPKERFISYPGCASDEDGENVYGWAGWNHLQQAQALATLYQKRRTEEDWKKERLVPMLAGLLELVPWVKQWHNEKNEEFGGLRLGEYFETFLDAQCRELGVTREDLRGWRPESKKRGGKQAGKKKAEDGE